MMKPVVGHATLNLGSEADPLPAWREALAHATPEAMIKLLVDLAAWAQRHPKSADALTLLGDAYLKVKQPYAAEKAFRGALAREPNSPRAREGLGLALMATDRHADAAKHLGLAHKLNPTNAEILVHWGLSLMRLTHLKAAHKRFEMALQCDPSNAQARLNLGLVDARRGAWQSAISHFRQAVQLNPDLVEAHHNLALALRQNGQLIAALSVATHLTEKNPQHGPNWILLAELHLNAGTIEPAQDALQRALSIDPGDANLYLTQASLYTAQRQYVDAEGVLKTALALGHMNPDIQLEMGYLQLLQGRFDIGWDLTETRKGIAHSPVQHISLPEWQGKDVGEQSVLVHSEQGLGNTIMFASCVPDLLLRTQNVVIEAPAKLVPIFERSFPAATVVQRHNQNMDGDWLQRFSPPITQQIPIGSLPKHFRRDRSQFPAHTGYLRAAPGRVAYWRDQLAHHDRPVVGIAWRGGVLQTGRERRSLSLSEWAPTLRDCPVQWISLQYGADAAEEAKNATQSGMNLPHWADVLEDQDEVAALTCALDAVVTVCSTQAHLTGALGRPGWVLTPFNPNWCYGEEGETMSWYPSLRLLRQTKSGDWLAPITKLQNGLAMLNRS